MGALTIRIKKQTDGSAALSCTRADGSVTWLRQVGVQGRFFPLHDLTHFAVETTLGHRRGFYGLVASGWDITDFGVRPLPPDTDPSELIVGFLDAERAGGVRWAAEDLNDKIRLYHEERGLITPVEVTEAELAATRQRRAELFAEWNAVTPGEALVLSFEPEAPA